MLRYMRMFSLKITILRTPEANASRAMQWLNVSYSAWFNAKRQRAGHLFQGRFRSTLIDGDGGWLLDMSAPAPEPGSRVRSRIDEGR
jgi:hypothetical protein